MCGIVAAISQRNVTSLLVECLRRLEYRGYDSAGIAILNNQQKLERVRSVGKIERLSKELKKHPISGNMGIAHTRWATHGAPTENNAHPHFSRGTIALVHNGIIENYEELRRDLIKEGHEFSSDTDTEVIAHSIFKYYDKKNDFLAAVQKAVKSFRGAFALAIINAFEPEKIVAVRSGSPVVIGVGIEENFIASDALALLPVTNNFIYLEEGDIAVVERTQVKVFNSKLSLVKRPIKVSGISLDNAERGEYRHFMQKEIFEQPQALADTLEERLSGIQVFPEVFGVKAKKIFNKVKSIQIVACGSSYNAALAGRYWIEKYTLLPCKVEIASEFRYRKVACEANTLFVTISQSGETADTLAALRQAKKSSSYLATLTICNVPESSLIRESDLAFLTHAGVEIGVATTKAFTAQLTALLMLTLAIGRVRGKIDDKSTEKLVKQLKHLPIAAERVLGIDDQIFKQAKLLTGASSMFFLGRGINFPIALEGALKMKEISYIHAEAYPAGELKHGPLALIDEKTPVIVIISNDELFEKVKSNLHEVRARGGELFIFADEALKIHSQPGWNVCKLPSVSADIAPIIYTIPLQLLSYHVAVLRGTDVDRPRNLAKSVTVE